jgi:hypothetical protein
MKFDRYFRIARIYPSVIILIPFLIFTIYCKIDNMQDAFTNLLKIKIIGNITISIVLLYLLVQINRFLGKFIFERYMFKNELEMPTTNFMLYGNTEFSRDYKYKLREQIKSDFQIILPDDQAEIDDILDVRKRIVEAVGLIRQKVKVGRLLLQHNIEYGFFRNLIGGSIIGLLMSVFDIFYFYNDCNKLIGNISVVIACMFAILLIVHRPIIKNLGKPYAKRLFQEYLQK